MTTPATPDGVKECPSCETAGVFATDGSGPFDCYACGKKALPELPNASAWQFQHDETGRMTIVAHDGINDALTFGQLNPRYSLVGSMFTARQMHAYARAALEQRKAEVDRLRSRLEVKDAATIQLVCERDGYRERLEFEVTENIRKEAELAKARTLLRESLLGWDDMIENLELNGLHDDPNFSYRKHKEWIAMVESDATARDGGGEG